MLRGQTKLQTISKPTEAALNLDRGSNVRVSVHCTDYYARILLYSGWDCAFLTVCNSFRSMSKVMKASSIDYLKILSGNKVQS